MLWPRRGRKGLRLHRGALSHGGSRSYGGRTFAASLKLDLLPSPGFEAPARNVGKYGREVERRSRNSHKEGPVTDCGNGGSTEIRCSGGPSKGTGGACPIAEIGRATPPTMSRLEFHNLSA
jgi:hypothetical protein